MTTASFGTILEPNPIEEALLIITWQVGASKASKYKDTFKEHARNATVDIVAQLIIYNKDLKIGSNTNLGVLLAVLKTHSQSKLDERVQAFFNVMMKTLFKPSINSIQDVSALQSLQIGQNKYKFQQIVEAISLPFVQKLVSTFDRIDSTIVDTVGSFEKE